MRPVRNTGPHLLPVRDERHDFADGVNDAYWAAKHTGPPEPEKDESLDMYKARVCAGMIPSIDSDWDKRATTQKVFYQNPSMQKTVIERAIKVAHEGPLVEIPYQDSIGRECSRFIGRKSDWMGQFRAVPMQSPIYEPGTDRPMNMATMSARLRHEGKA